MGKNILWNFAGQGGPLIAALFTVPIVISALGTDRFGVLTIAWMVIGYFGLFDLGLGRALTKLLAERLGEGRDSENAALIWTGISLLAGLGLVAGIALALLAPRLAGNVLNVPPGLQAEVVETFWLLACTLPMVFVTTGLRAVLEAHRRFDLANLVVLPLGFWTFVSPLLVLPFSNRLSIVVLVLVAGRGMALAANAFACGRVRPGIFATRHLRTGLIPRLLSFGGWITVSHVVGPVMVYFDRFLIGSWLTLSAVAHYTTPYEMVTKLSVVPSAVVGVLFPALAATLTTDPDRAAEVFDRGNKAIFALLTPLSLIACTLAHEGLRLWIGPAFAAESFRVAQWLAAGVLVNGAAWVPLTAIQAVGRPDLTAKLHLIELPCYVAALWCAIGPLGIAGAAAVWAARVSVDAVALFLISGTLLPATRAPARRAMVRVLFALAVLFIGAMLPNVSSRLAFLLIGLPIFALVCWRAVMNDEDRVVAKGWMRPLKVQGKRP